MSNKDLRSQLEGLFSDIVPEPEVEKKDESLLEEAVVGPTEAEIAEAQLQHLRAGGEDPLDHLFREATECASQDKLTGPCNSTSRFSARIRRILT